MNDIYKENRQKIVLKEVVKAYHGNYGALYENSVLCSECRYREVCDNKRTCADNINDYIEGKWKDVHK